MKRPSGIFLPILLLLGSQSKAQETVNSAGGNAGGSSGTVSYSIGQVLYSTHTGTTGSEAQGVQQAFEIFTVGTKAMDKNLILSVFPNPAFETLILQTGEFKKEKLKYRLLDMQGKLLLEANILEAQTCIDMAHFPSATYLVNVYDQNNNEKQIFKIIKK
jgi:hypothetical protein